MKYRTDTLHALRFNEWGLATWDLQKAKLNGADIPTFHFMSYTADDARLSEMINGMMYGKVMQDRVQIPIDYCNVSMLIVCFKICNYCN